VTPAAAPIPRPPLVDLIDRETSEPRMARILGPAAAEVPRHVWQRALLDPAREILSRPSKGIRARLVHAGWSLAAGHTAAMPPDLPWVVELLHAGSLIVDDIQDDSDTRRGGPALHRMLGVPVALNAGNWLYFVATSLLARMPLRASIVAELQGATATAVTRCHYGQALDLSVSVDALRPSEVPAVVQSIASLKTGSLLELATTLGAVGAGARPERVEAIARFGRELGEALQMLDDISGLVVPRRKEKGLEDLRHARATWPWAWVAQRLPRDQVQHLLDLQREVAARRAEPVVLRAALVHQVGDDGLELARCRLARSLSRLRSGVGDDETIGVIEREMDRLVEGFLGTR